MTKLFYLTALLGVFCITGTSAQSIDALREKIQQIVSAKKVFAGVAIMGNGARDTLTLNGESHLPMQSVFKFHIALAVLNKVDEGKLSLNQKITILKKDLLPGLYSPIREKYPEGVTLPLSEILTYTVAESDNAGCDVLLKLIGGPAVVEKYFAKNHFTNLSVKFNEETQQGTWDLQFQNWTTPKAANEVLNAFYLNSKKLLSKKSYDFIWATMKKTETGKNRLKGELPPATVVAHKTGTSGVNKDGITAAVNDIGVVFLPGGGHYFISVFVTDSREDAAANEKIIADISKAAWDYFTGKQ